MLVESRNLCCWRPLRRQTDYSGLKVFSPNAKMTEVARRLCLRLFKKKKKAYSFASN